MIGHQWLYTALSAPPCPASQLLCTRHDVDGLLWSPSGDPATPWQHVATLQAFGYVLASKQNRRFVASPAFSGEGSVPAYVAVADISRHVYVYWQPAPSRDGLQEVRNRKSKVVMSPGNRLSVYLTRRRLSVLRRWPRPSLWLRGSRCI